MNRLIFLGVGLAVGYFHLAIAQATECDVTAVARCCVEAMGVECVGGAKGYMRNDAKLERLKVRVTSRNGTSREVVLNDPPGGIRDYYAIRYNDWVTGQLRLRYGDEVEVARNGYVVSDDTPLYDDFSADTFIMRAGQNRRSNRSSQYDCNYTGQPYLIDAQQCGQKICFGEANCRINGREGLYSVACHANSNETCPTANECADSPTANIRSRVSIQSQASAISSERRIRQENANEGLGN